MANADSAFQEALQRLKDWRKREKSQTVMDEIIPGLFVGGLRAATDPKLMSANRIQAIVSVITTEVNLSKLPFVSHKLQIPLDDLPNATLGHYFGTAIRFIHENRLEKRNVLVHCLMGVSRSVSLVIAYLITVTELRLERAHEFVRQRRYFANPNFGFREQLKSFYNQGREEQRKMLRNEFAERHEELQAQDALYLKSL
ncbi:Dual specificity protein phosphatase 22 isoform X2 [Aphelenchoides besseyi]|nr:Dual specificity protein phosphatase 22 isoform X2 [Aphelenchoides besseyi]